MALLKRLDIVVSEARFMWKSWKLRFSSSGSSCSRLCVSVSILVIIIREIKCVIALYDDRARKNGLEAKATKHKHSFWLFVFSCYHNRRRIREKSRRFYFSLEPYPPHHHIVQLSIQQIITTNPFNNLLPLKIKLYFNIQFKRSNFPNFSLANNTLIYDELPFFFHFEKSIIPSTK